MGIILKMDLFRSDTLWLIEKIGLYLDSMEAAIAAGRDADRERIKHIEISSADDIDDQREELHLHTLLFEEDFPSKLRYSFVLMSYILFESRSHALAEELKRRKKVIGRTLKKKNGESFPQAVQRFLESQPNGITITPDVWAELTDFNDLRNCIVHMSGDVNNWKYRSRVEDIIRKNKTRGLSLNQSGFLQMEADYCQHLVKNIQGFFDEVFVETDFGPAEQIITGQSTSSTKKPAQVYPERACD